MQLARFATQRPEPRWFLGLDLGQRHDHSALAAIELSWQPQGRSPIDLSWLFHCQLTIRRLERFPLGACYDELHSIVLRALGSVARRDAAAPAEVVIDAGGPGPPMVDRLRRSLPRGIRLTPVILTGAKSSGSLANGYRSIPRREVVTGLIQFIASGALIAPASLHDWQKFAAEMVELAGESTQPASRRAHDDLVIAAGLASWAAVNHFPGAPDFGYVDKPLL
jgi:hypothetical protein